nr:helix-turn-helix transcriptional regulator [uncultured Devosia sp.]
MRGQEILTQISWSGDVHPDTIASIEAAILDLDRRVYGTNRTTYSEAQVHFLLTKFIEDHGGIRKAAEAMNLSKSYLSDVINSHRPPSKKVIAALGLSRSIKKSFVKVD